MPERIHDQDHYEILALPASPGASNGINEKDIKLAYRRALLVHHPDKSKPSSNLKPKTSKYTVDQITIAYKTLIDPATRSEYDRLRASKPSPTSTAFQPSHPGLETVDLDDLSYDERQGLWYRGCRCGKSQAYTVFEEELEDNAEHGEIVAGCEGCSLWLRVTFAVAEDG